MPTTKTERDGRVCILMRMEHNTVDVTAWQFLNKQTKLLFNSAVQPLEI